ncbi:MAG: prepilin-type N-terminal cleavage/methylation domain-containing protein [Parcubacteria group bacterium]
MPVKKIKKNNSSGFTLIEALVFLFIFVLITITFYQVFTLGTKYIIDSKNRLGAITLANERMEMVRNLSYANIGTVNGTISGNIPQKQDVMENGRTYSIKTEVVYVQDPLDGVAPADVAFEDYKKVTIIVSWNSSQNGSGEVRLTSRFVPPGLEVANPGDGILSINVFSDQPGGTGISNSTVHVVNTQTGLDTTLETDSAGSLMLMGNKVTESIQKYEITVSKSDYETVATMPPYPDSPYNPVNTHASVAIGSINVANIVQNKLSNLKVKSVDYLDAAVSDIGFDIEGGKMIGTGITPPYTPVYNMKTTTSTGSGGEKDFGPASPGTYKAVVSSSALDNYEIIGTDPISPFYLSSNAPIEFKIKLASKNFTSLLVRALKNVSEEMQPVAGAKVVLTNTSGYSAEQTANADGSAFFPISADPFIAGDYTYKITADKFKDKSSTITVNTDELKVESVTLEPNP